MPKIKRESWKVKKVPAHVKIPELIYDVARKYAARRGKNLSEHITELLEKHHGADQREREAVKLLRDVRAELAAFRAASKQGKIVLRGKKA